MTKKPYAIIVDDDESIRDLMVFVLEDANFEVCTATTDEELNGCLGTRIPDVVWLDLVLPELDSFLVLAQLKKTYPHIKVVCMTAYANEVVSNKVHTLGADALVSKPFMDIEDIVTITNAVLGEPICQPGLGQSLSGKKQKL